jgi:predicted glycoside hydrolase/deacetylase ChbG (UPF0249 family)
VRIVINADDFGLSEDTVAATIAAFGRMALTSGTIMTNMPATELALGFARANPQFSFGVHLTWTLATETQRPPLAPPHEIRSLLGADGKLRSSNDLKLRAMLGLCAVKDIEAEARRQIEFVLRAGISVSHLDSHSHLHKFPPFQRALASVVKEFNIQRIRNVQNIYFTSPYRSVTYHLGRFWRSRLETRFRTSTYFYMPASESCPIWPERVAALSGRGTLEVGVHPGYDEPWRKAETESVLQLASMIDGRHELVTWREI